MPEPTEPREVAKARHLLRLVAWGHGVVRWGERHQDMPMVREILLEGRDYLAMIHRFEVLINEGDFRED